MTKLIYKITKDGATVATVLTYAEAEKLKTENYGSKVVVCYEPVPEKTAVFLSPKKLAMRVKAN